MNLSRLEDDEEDRYDSHVDLSLELEYWLDEVHRQYSQMRGRNRLRHVILLLLASAAVLLQIINYLMK
jgi:hypothetical protein